MQLWLSLLATAEMNFNLLKTAGRVWLACVVPERCTA
jgi:hypothetical protein